MLTVLRYAERNPLRAKWVRKAENWRWSSAALWSKAAAERLNWLSVGPLPRPRPWLDFVNAALTSKELESIRTCITRGAPYGSAEWVQATAKSHGLESNLRPWGRLAKPKTD